MNRVAILLTCAFAAYAQYYHKAPPVIVLYRRQLNDDVQSLEDGSPSSLPDLFAEDDLTPQDLVSVDQTPEDPTPVDPTSDDSVNKGKYPFFWEPPTYSAYLRYTDEAVARISSHFNPDALLDKNDADFRYVVVSYVLYSLAQRVSEKGWNEYEGNYEALVKQYMQTAILDPQYAADRIRCDVLETTQFAISAARKLIVSYPIDFMCSVQPESCDNVIWAVLTKVGNVDEINSANRLETAGRTSELFLKEYANTFEAVSKINVYRYILYAKVEFRPLVDLYARLLSDISYYTITGCPINR